MTESVIFGTNMTVNGDLACDGGYFGAAGGPNYIVEIKGNISSSGSGQIAIGTGTGRDHEVILSGTSKTYVWNSTASATFQHLTISGDYTFSGTKLSIATVYQEFSVTGTFTINKAAVTVTRIDLTGTWGTFTGTIDGTGRIFYYYDKNSSVPTTGTIGCSFFRIYIEEDGAISINDDQEVDGWTNVNQDWTHHGTSPYLDDDDGDVNYISIPADDPSVGLYDEYYDFEDMDGSYLSITPTKVRIHAKIKLIAGTGGTATLIALKGYLWDGSIWQDGGTAFTNSTTYADLTFSTDLSGVIDNLTKLNQMRLKLEVNLVIGGGADKGDIAVTYAYVEIEGSGYEEARVFLNPRKYENGCKFEIEYSIADQVLQLENGGLHEFNGGVEFPSDNIEDAEFDCETENVQMWVRINFNVHTNAFSNDTITIKVGNNYHVIRGSWDFYFAYAGIGGQLDCQPDEGCLILAPLGREIIIIPPP